MKHSYYLIFLLLGFFVHHRAYTQINTPPLRITKLTENFYIYTTYKSIDGVEIPANCMYFVTDKGVVLIDSPWDSTQFQPLLDSIESRYQKKVILCIATHYHEDRTGGLEFLKLKNIPTFTSKKTYDLCAEFNEKQAEFYFTKDTTFNIGNYIFQTYFPGEGHTSDNIIIWFPKERILYGGCFIKSTDAETLGNVANANTSEWLTSIKKIRKLIINPNFIIPGHFGWTDLNSLKHTQKLLMKYRLANER